MSEPALMNPLGLRIEWNLSDVTFMSCEEKVRLAEEYEVSVRKFAEIVRQLQQNIGTSMRQEYECLQRAAEEARVRSEQARLALEQHMAAHDCRHNRKPRAP